MAEGHHYVFNQLPVRLLTFKKNGTDIKLITRPQVWSTLRDKLEVQLNSIPISKLPAFQLSDFAPMRYAILSHTWIQYSSPDVPGETTYHDWISGRIDKSSTGYRKLENFCRIVSREYNLSFAWMDTVCIDQGKSAELDESILSMYNWYSNSYICVAYLSNTVAPEDVVRDRWFKRGWTLQELLAPRYIHFFNAHWESMDDLGTGGSQVSLIGQASGITEEELKVEDLNSIPISRRMQWAAGRSATRQEDKAYSLMGIFSVTMSIAYGEGAERAFSRLLSAILNTYRKGVFDIFNYGYGSHPRVDVFGYRFAAGPSVSSLFPPSAEAYTWAVTGVTWPSPASPITLSHLGLCVRILFIPGIKIHSDKVGRLQEKQKLRQPSSNMFTELAARIFISDLGEIAKKIGDEFLGWLIDNTEVHYFCTHHRMPYSAIAGPIQLDSEGFGWSNGVYYSVPSPFGWGKSAFIPIFAVLNFEETLTDIVLPKGPCFALLDSLSRNPSRSGRISDKCCFEFSRSFTKEAIQFDLVAHGCHSRSIPKSSLAKYNMALRTYYL